MHGRTDDPLALDPEEMRRVGYRTIDLLVQRIAEDGPPNVRIEADELLRRLGGPPTEEPLGFDAALERLERDVLPFAMRNDHPGFFGFIPTSPTWPGALGDLIGSALAIDASSWAEAAGPSAVEVTVLRWFANWIGYPEEALGVLVSGGSAANLTALACARERVAPERWRAGAGYIGDQCHSSVPRALRALGFTPEQIRVLPTDRDRRLDPDVLARAVAADLRRGLLPLLAVANAGATSTGAVDPLHALADVCAEAGVWLHVDAAYGGFAVLTERGRAAIGGLERADSVTLDPHKWLYQPWECGAVLVRDGADLRRTFAIVPDYLVETRAAPGETSFGDLGLQLSRSPRALKVWISVTTFGLAAFRAAIDRSLDLADLARARIASHPQLELVAPPSLSITCFRRVFPEVHDVETEDLLHRALAAEVERAGLGIVTTTVVDGRVVLRLCVLNHASTEDRVRTVVDLLATAEVDARRAGEGLAGTDPRVHAWAGLGGSDDGGTTTEILRELPLLADADEEALVRIARVARVVEVEGEVPIVVHDDAGGDFFLVRRGSVRVEVDGVVVARIGAGDFFGEIASLDWGSGYGYARTATVVADGDVELVVLPDRTLELAMHLVPRLRREVRARFYERLGRR